MKTENWLALFKYISAKILFTDEIPEIKEIRSTRKLETIMLLVFSPLVIFFFTLWPLYGVFYKDDFIPEDWLEPWVDDFTVRVLTSVSVFVIFTYSLGKAFVLDLPQRAERRRELQELESKLTKRKQLMEQFKGQRLSADRQNHLRRRVPLYSKLPDHLIPKLEERILQFLEVVEFKKKKIRRVTKKMRDIVAAEACLLIVNRSLEDYIHLKVVEIWGDPIGKLDNGIVTAVIAGSAFQDQRVRLWWRGVDDNLPDGEDNANIILHEFAHILDFAGDDESNSIPVSEDSPDYKEWETLLKHEYPRLQKAHVSGRGHVIKDYSISRDDQAEFFSCATESFFERPKELREKHRRIYKCMKNFYRLDPAEW